MAGRNSPEDPPATAGVFATDLVTRRRGHLAVPPAQTGGLPRWSVPAAAAAPVAGGSLPLVFGLVEGDRRHPPALADIDGDPGELRVEHDADLAAAAGDAPLDLDALREALGTADGM